MKHITIDAEEEDKKEQKKNWRCKIRKYESSYKT